MYQAALRTRPCDTFQLPVALAQRALILCAVPCYGFCRWVSIVAIVLGLVFLGIGIGLEVQTVVQVSET